MRKYKFVTFTLENGIRCEKADLTEVSARQYWTGYLKGSKTVEALCEEHQISPATFYKWKKEVETEKNEDKKRLKELETENLRLKKMYAELQLKHEVVSEAVEILKKMKADRKRRI